MDPTAPFPINEVPEASQKKSDSYLLFVIPAFIVFILLIFGTLHYFNVLSLGLSFLPQRTTPVSVLPPPPAGGLTPKTLQIDPNFPPLPISVNDPVVGGVSVYYRLIGKVEKVLPQANGDIGIRIKADGATAAYPAPFTISSKQTVVTEKGKGFQGFSLSEIKAGDTLELIYLVDLRSGQTLVTQAQVERGE